ncbi:MAG: hypothetical protein Q8R50_03625 [Sediminibacterium sp.]|nr:hypothetical protein [Sediminibacterium sp.]
MKKLRLNLQNLNDAEVLTRQQLKNILGGDGSGGCVERAGSCNTSQKINCCSGLVCAEYKCYLGTL